MAGFEQKSSLAGALICALIIFTAVNGAVSLGLPCKTEGQTCSAVVSFVPKEATNVSAITSLFQLSSYWELLGVNAWNFSLGANWGIPKGTIVKVPITCACSNGTGISKDGPKYKVQPGNTLSVIADTIFGGLMTYYDIQKVNSQIKDVNKILAGDTFRIPLPCSCSPSTTTNEIHYSYVVQQGNTLDDIASQADSTESTLMKLNNITNSSLLAAGQIIDVPLKACSSNFSTTATDKLLVANGSYAFTASSCLQCSCGPSDLDLYCVKSNLSTSCTSMTCKNSNLMVGSMSIAKTSSGCNVTKCSYDGYTSSKTILTNLETSIQPQCPANHVFPTLTTPQSSLAPSPAPAPGTESPASPSSGAEPTPSPSSGAEPTASPSGGAKSPGSTTGDSGPSKSMAADSISSLPLATMLVLGLPILIHFGEW